MPACPSLAHGSSIARSRIAGRQWSSTSIRAAATFSSSRCSNASRCAETSSGSGGGLGRLKPTPTQSKLLRSRWFGEGVGVDRWVDLHRRQLSASGRLTAGSDGERDGQIHSAELLPLHVISDLLAHATLRDLSQNASGRWIDVPLERRAAGV